MDISIIIVNYKTVSLIMDCIKSIKEFTSDIDYEIIVVDNNSNDDFQSKIQSVYSDVICIPLKSNMGFGVANNEGFKVAKGRNLLCLNPDTILLNNAIKILSNYLDSHNHVGACGGNLFDENMKPSLSFRRILPSIYWEINELCWLLPERIQYRSNRIFNNTSNPFSVGYITGADLMIKRIVIDEVGGFSPDFFMYYEETDLCNRIKNQGWDIHSVPYAKIMHLESKSFNNHDNHINKKKVAFIEKGRKVYYCRNHTKLYQKIANAIYVVFLCSRMFLLRLNRDRRWEVYKTHLELRKTLV